VALRFIADVDLEAVAAALAPRLIAYALARTGRRADAEDVAQEALTALVRRWRRAGPPESPDAFVFAIARRRAGRAVARGALLAPLDVVRHIAQRGPSVEETAVGRSAASDVVSAIRSLPRRDREALLLRVVGELDFDRIASLTRTTPAGVKMRISRARRRLATLLAERTDGRRTRTA